MTGEEAMCLVLSDVAHCLVGVVCLTTAEAGFSRETMLPTAGNRGTLALEQKKGPTLR